ncbi:PREDICTED: histone-lysine N-methyltransferase, H3 lysine-79 specific-like [Camelina sativa]|uniref:Histone-lysine N-methyltransferase, H3 lysine-79 specific-like n=1 Tax=Camelina sativa TaxID=90675 RepID=A0ABM0X2K8_CAMSA|nr:PREDICTED: histone-lysine N-methyltransferase, H3 lysine-79 specific-like [Camelina sativa]
MNGGDEAVAASADPSLPLELRFSQVFGERGAGEEVQEVEIISAIEFDNSGDRGGRVVLFERTDANIAPVCQTCGDIGFEEALVFCDSCKIEAIHRYCVGITPTPFTEYITWICEDCDGSESESDSIEVDHTAKLTHILKKSDRKKKKKKKKRKRSSNHTWPVLAEDHGLQDATNVEPMEVSSSPIKETVESNSGTDHNAGTSKRSDSSSYRKEVDQADKLLNISKENEKEKKKKKKKKKNKEDKTNKEKKTNTMSSNPSPLVLAFEDHGVQDATNIEPVKVFSSPIKGTTKESRKRKSSDSGNPHELTGLVRNGASASEAERSSSVPDHSSCTSKRNDCGSGRKEVDQTANLGPILEKSEKKKKKKKKKKKRSSSHSPPVLAVENNELHDATNVEPVEVSSSPQIKETMEAKRQESSGSRKPHELTGLDGNGASVSEAENSSSVRDHNSYTTKKRKLSSGNIQLSENRQLADGNSSCKEAELNMPQTSERLPSMHCRAQPIKIPIWRGLMSVKGGNSYSFDGITAHVSSLACPKVHEVASSLRGCLSAEMFPRMEIWPQTFVKNGGPKDDSVALFFFPSSESNDEKTFYSLVGEMEKNDLAMRCLLDDAELLLFTSFLLPVYSWSFYSKDYLWGVFKTRRTSQH